MANQGHYYNEWDPHAAQWLRNLCGAKLIPDGIVDTQDIRLVSSEMLKDYGQCHFFAGIGGWSYALELAGWSPARSVWTGSCPCQPFSSAGSGKGQDDDRHLWPAFFRLIRECHPDTIFGEQVAGAVGFGWLDGICGDLEGEGYAVGATVLGAHSVSAPHIRQRLYWVAHTKSRTSGSSDDISSRESNFSDVSRMADTRYSEQSGRNDSTILDDRISEERIIERRVTTSRSTPNGMEFASGQQMGLPGQSREPGGSSLGMGDTQYNGSSSFQKPRESTEERGLLESERSSSGLGISECEGLERPPGGILQTRDTRSPSTIWDGYDRIPCRDGRTRRTQSGLQPLAHGVPFRLADGRTRENVSRQAILKGIGNAIVPQVAAAFIRAFLATEEGRVP